MSSIDDRLATAMESHRAGDLQCAEKAYRAILSQDPRHSDALHLLGMVAHQQGDPHAAIAFIERAIAANPNVASFHSSLGAVRQQQGEFGAAAVCLRRAVELRPDVAEVHRRLADALWQQGRRSEAITSYGRASRLEPNNTDAHYRLGIAHREHEQIDEAVDSFRRALQLAPNVAELHYRLGDALQEQGEVDAAVDSFRQALAKDPDHVLAHSNLALALLSSGQFKEGWREYEWRWKTGLTPRSFDQPPWTGESLRDRTILVYAEQGLGDTIQFIRFLPILKRQGGTVILECQPALRQLLANVQGIDVLVGKGEDLPAFDLHCPLLSLPRILQTTLRTIPAEIPYLAAEPAAVCRWRDELAGCRGRRVGIAWQGNPGVPRDRLRSIPVRHFAPLATIPDVRLVSLQKGTGVEQLDSPGIDFPLLDLSDSLDAHTGAFVDTAAVMMHLDLVVTSDTSIAHLAGALGVPVWTALPFRPDWRWLRAGENCVWYPTMRLFRQSRRRDWQEVFERIAAALR